MSNKDLTPIFNEKQINILLSVEKDSIITSISRKTEITPSSILTNLKEFEKKGLIIRKKTGRMNQINLTEKGNLFIIPPCGSCRQLIHDMDESNLDTEIILDKNKVVKLKELLPYSEWWQKQ